MIQPEPRLLTARQVAERLGLDVRTVRKMIGLGQLPSRRVGARSMVLAADLDLFLQVSQAAYGGLTYGARLAQARAVAEHTTGEDGR